MRGARLKFACLAPSASSFLTKSAAHGRSLPRDLLHCSKIFSQIRFVKPNRAKKTTQYRVNTQSVTQNTQEKNQWNAQ